MTIRRRCARSRSCSSNPAVASGAVLGVIFRPNPKEGRLTRHICRIAVLALAAALATSPALAQSRGNQEGGGTPPSPPPPIAERTKQLKKIDGFYPMYWDDNGGRLFVEIPRLDTEVLHATSMATGLGSNDIGIDRGQLTGSRIIK